MSDSSSLLFIDGERDGERRESELKTTINHLFWQVTKASFVACLSIDPGMKAKCTYVSKHKDIVRMM